MLIPKIVDYDILICSGKRNTTLAVIDAIKRGWQPLGPVIKYNYDDYYQTMVKYEQPKLNQL